MAPMPPLKKPRLDDGAATALALLPPTLLEHMLSYLVDGDGLVDPNGYKHFFRTLDEFKTMATVCREWRALAEEAASTCTIQSLYIRWKRREPEEQVPTRSEVLEVRRKIILRRPYLQRFIMGDSISYGKSGYGVWCAALSHVPALQALELDAFAMEARPSNRMDDIVRAAVRYCHELKTLTLPHELRAPYSRELAGRRTDHHMRVLSKAVFEGREVWSRPTGLRRLIVPMHEIMKTHVDATTYIDTTIQYCPRIQRLEGFLPYQSSRGGLTDEEFWQLDLETWERFCKVCDQLEYFDWICAQFATALFEVFGNHVRPTMSHLGFSTSGSWKRSLRLSMARPKKRW